MTRGSSRLLPARNLTPPPLLLSSSQLDPKYRLLPSVIPFSSIRVLDLEENAIGGVELSGKIDARGPARRNSDALMEELEGLKLWQDRL